MALRIKESDPELTIPRLDGGGIPIFHYKGSPFTGIVYENEKDGSLAWEEEYKNGFQEGWIRYYHKNGRIKKEFNMHNNLELEGRIWDENGNLLESF